MWPCYLAGVQAVICQVFSPCLIGIIEGHVGISEGYAGISEGGVGISEGYVGIIECVGSSGANLPSAYLHSISAHVFKKFPKHFPSSPPSN